MLCLARGRCCAGFLGCFGVEACGLACSRHGEFARNGRNAVESLCGPFFMEVGRQMLGEFPTEPVTSEAHPYSPQVKARKRFRYHLPVQGRTAAVRARRMFLDRRPVQGRVVAVQGQYLQHCSLSRVVSCLLSSVVLRGMPQALVPSFSFVEIWLCKLVKYIYIYKMVCSFVFTRTVV
ncbi:hypothetical protein Taro_019332 [Colocasia esculenta]|uniref:Uncharacterized protein n=1 Tax=Colocasia esculenta TaxID=4460 RepID=A0A843UKU7_COLES|nr:hypothetical protein [Colocasia esculenta]